MRQLYDVTRDIFEAEIYPGDPVPRQYRVMSFDKKEPDLCQLTKLTMGSHTGTHIDAPRHFLQDGKGIDEIDLQKCIGKCKVVTAAQEGTLAKHLQEGAVRILFRGEFELTEEEARFLAEQKVVLVGTEGLSIAPMAHPQKVHRILLEEEIVIIEGLDLSGVEDGEYEIYALPLKMKGMDGSPARVILRQL